jgi:5-(carboxyamino)imidazole ribonucleotide synthase
MSLVYDLGFLGGGQLARMSIMAAQRMGLTCISLDPGENTPASQIAPAMRGSLDDPEAVAHLFNAAARVTLENEFIPAQTIKQALIIAGRDESCLTPGILTLATIQDKYLQREAYHRHGAPSPLAVPLEGDYSEAITKIGFPMVLKARFGGYDGKGTRYARTPVEFQTHRGLIDQGNWMAEQFVPFSRELAVMVYRSKTETGTFPTMETVQVNHVCDQVFPAGIDASAAAIAAVEAVQGYGLFGVELFETTTGNFLINEIAPRPHNTGHYTLDWGGVSQFEQHVRLAMGFPCALPTGADTCMVNILGIDDLKSDVLQRDGLVQTQFVKEEWISSDTDGIRHPREEPAPGLNRGGDPVRESTNLHNATVPDPIEQGGVEVQSSDYDWLSQETLEAAATKALLKARQELFASHPQAHLHWYGKTESRPGRKMGHINVSGPDCRNKAITARNSFIESWQESLR